MIPKNVTISLDHIGIAVPSLGEGASFFEALGLSQTSTEKVESEGVEVGFFPLKNSVNIELLESLNEDGPIAKFLNKRGPGIHHICMKVEGIENLVEHLKAKGVQLINDVPRKGAHNMKVVFVHPKSTGGVLVELSEPMESKS